LLTCFENDASKAFNDIIENCKKCLSCAQHADIEAQLACQPTAQDAPAMSFQKDDANWTMKLRSGFFELKGSRETMEDAHDIYQQNEERFAYYAVYDGHCGKGVSIFVREHLRKYIFQYIAGYKNPTSKQIQDAIYRAFARVEEEITDPAGSTAVVVLIDKKERVLYCGNLGDSRATISANGNALPLSHDHKIKDADEANRLRNAGGIILNNRIITATSCIGLAVARSFGDKKYKYTQKLAEMMSEPEITVRPIEPTDEFLIIACDGLWDVMGNQEATAFVAKTLQASKGDVASTARDLVNHAIFHLLSPDNVTAIVVTLH